MKICNQIYPIKKTLEDLKSIVASSSVDIEKSFKELHHHSRHPPFSINTKPSSYKKFVKYCEDLSNGIQLGKENERTIQRVYRFMELAETRHRSDCISESWEDFPLVTSK